MKNPIEAYKEIRSQIFEALEPDAINSMSSEQLAKQLKQAVELLIDKDQLSVSAVTRQQYVQNLVDELHGLGPLQSLMDDDSITDVMINGYENIFIERDLSLIHI